MSLLPHSLSFFLSFSLKIIGIDFVAQKKTFISLRLGTVSYILLGNDHGSMLQAEQVFHWSLINSLKVRVSSAPCAGQAGLATGSLLSPSL